MNLYSKYNLSQLKSNELNVTAEMQEKINLWADMIAGTAPWNLKYKPSGVINAISGALTNPVDEEIKVTAFSDKLNDVMTILDSNSNQIVSDMVLSGGCVCRPVYSNSRIQFELIRLGNYIPTHYDLDGTLTGAMLLKSFIDGKKDFLLVENHSYKNKTHSVNLELFRTDGGKMEKVNLSSCSQTAGLTESWQWENVDKPFIIEFRNRRQNNIDGSQFPVAIYSGYENLIEDADRQYNNINWEQIAGRTKTFIDEDLLPKKKLEGTSKTYTVVPQDMKDVFVMLEGNGVDAAKIQEHSPQLRTAQQIEAFNEILRRIELACNIGKGTLSNLESSVQTATQYTGGKKALYTAVDTIESELELKYHHCAYVFAYMLSAYEGIKFDDAIEITFNDSARKDPMQMKAEAIQELQNNILNPWEFRMKFYGEDEATAKANCPTVDNGSLTVGGFSLFE